MNRVIATGWVPLQRALPIHGQCIGVVGFEAARRTASWPGALIALAGRWIIVSSFVGGLQAGTGHLLMNLLTGLTVIALTLFVYEAEATRA